jgi:hypothetical protein
MRGDQVRTLAPVAASLRVTLPTLAPQSKTTSDGLNIEHIPSNRPCAWAARRFLVSRRFILAKRSSISISSGDFTLDSVTCGHPLIMFSSRMLLLFCEYHKLKFIMKPTAHLTRSESLPTTTVFQIASPKPPLVHIRRIHTLSADCEFAKHHISRLQRKSAMTGRTAAS